MPTNTTIERLLPETMPRDLRALAISYRRHLLAENRSPQTIKSYLDSIRIFALFLNGNGMPTNPEEISREHVESFVADQLARHRPNSAGTRIGAVKAFYVWLLDEGEITHNPTAKVRKPVADDPPPTVLSDDDLTSL